jgi:hypothetical protein
VCQGIQGLTGTLLLLQLELLLLLLQDDANVLHACNHQGWRGSLYTLEAGVQVTLRLG